MQFTEFQQIFAEHSKRLMEHQRLFIVDVPGDDLWSTYIESFLPEHNQIFRERREFDCSCCRSFIRRVGGLVAITISNELLTLWDFDTNDDVYQPMLEAMRAKVRAEVGDVFFSDSFRIGTPVTHEELEVSSLTWNHLYIEFPNRFILRGKELQEKLNELRTSKQMFLQALREFPVEVTQDVLDMIDEGYIPRGNEYKRVLEGFKEQQLAFRKVPVKKQAKFAWRVSSELPMGVSRIRGTAIGTLLSDLSGGEMTVEAAVARWATVVDPTNFHRSKAIATPKMIEEAKRTAEKEGFIDSLPRRFAVIGDLTINDVLWASPDAEKAMSAGAFDDLLGAVEVSKGLLERAKPVPVDQFLAELRNISKLEVLFESSLKGNLVSLLAPVNKRARSIMRWQNNFGWAYSGNVADSMKQQVKAAGGQIEAQLRFSLRWNEQGDNNNDLDAHCFVTGAQTEHIYFANRHGNAKTRGMLDVDNTRPSGKVAIENIFWRTTDFIKPGTNLRFAVNCFSHRGGRDGFDAELEVNGQLFTFDHRKDFHGTVNVVDVSWDGREFSVKPLLPAGRGFGSGTPAWGLEPGKFHEVGAVSFSPNYWEGERCEGNKHLFFFIPGCINDEKPNAFFNEQLHPSLHPHRRVFEMLGAKLKVAESENQLSGLGFNDTTRKALYARINDRAIIKIVF